MIRTTVGGAVRGVVDRWRARRLLAPDLRRSPLLLVPSMPPAAVLRVGRRLLAPFAGVLPTRGGGPLGEPRRGTAPGDHPVDVVVHQPAADQRRGRGAVLWIHGGGHLFGSPEQDGPRCAAMADTLGVPVVAARYRVAPEHPFPADLDDCVAALAWLHAHADELGVDRTRVAVAGASAGGGLAAALAQRANDEGLPICYQALVYPMLDDRTVQVRDHPPGRGVFVWTPRSNAVAWGAYLGATKGSPAPAPPRYAVPARREDLGGLPPAWIGVGDLDLFHDEDLAYAERLRAAGVEVTLHVEPGMPHGLDSLDPLPPSMVAFHRRVVDALRPAVT